MRQLIFQLLGGKFYNKGEKRNGDMDSRVIFYKMSDILCLYIDGHNPVKEILMIQGERG